MAKPIVFTEHARQRMQDRGAREVDVIRAVELGQREPAQRGLHAERIVVVTVYTFYIAEGRAR